MLIWISSIGELDFLLGTDIVVSLLDIAIWYCEKFSFGRIWISVVSFVDFLSIPDPLDILILEDLSVVILFLSISEHLSPADL